MSNPFEIPVGDEQLAGILEGARGPLERGEAKLHLELAPNGYLRVTGYYGDILLQGPIPAGGWPAIVDAVLAAAPDATGLMRQAVES